MKLYSRLMVALVVLCLFTHQSEAHAFLDHSLPKVGSQVHGSPKSVTIWFTSELEPSFCTVQVFDSTGAEIDKKDAKEDDKDKAVMTVSLPSLAPGHYKVIWKAVAEDTHVTHGSFSFEVIP